MKREITSTRIRVHSASDAGVPNVVQRLRERIAQVRSEGIIVRTEWLDGHEPSWCDLQGIRTILLDASQPAAEQLGQLDEILTDISRFSGSHSLRDSRHAKRAA